MSLALNVCQAVGTAIQAPPQILPPYEVRIGYRPVVALDVPRDDPTLYVDIMPRSQSYAAASRGARYVDVGVSIVAHRQLTTDSQDVWMVDEIVDAISRCISERLLHASLPTAGGAVCIEASMDPIVDVEAIDQWRRAVVTTRLTYRYTENAE